MRHRKYLIEPEHVSSTVQPGRSRISACVYARYTYARVCPIYACKRLYVYTDIHIHMQPTMCTPLTYDFLSSFFFLSLTLSFSPPQSFSFSRTPARTHPCVLRAYPYRLVTPLVSSLANRPRLPRSLTLTFNSRAKVKA